jgi:hypothetical protein
MKLAEALALSEKPNSSLVYKSLHLLRFFPKVITDPVQAIEARCQPAALQRDAGGTKTPK